LEREERPLTYREYKIKCWISKNLPTLVKLLKPKTATNGYEFRKPVGNDKTSDASNAADAMTGENVDTQN
jgi:hypothetical protein